MAAIINGKHGTAVLVLGTLLLSGGLGALIYAIHEGYEPSVQVGATVISLRKHTDAAAVTQAAPEEKLPSAVPQQTGIQGV